MHRLGPIVAATLALSCGKTEESAVGLVKEVAAEVKARPRVEMRIERTGDEPSAVDQAQLRSLETAIEQKNAGRLVSSGFEPGAMTVTVEVESTADAIEQLQDIARGSGLAGKATYRVLAPQ
jgi:hypothetical protein